MVCGYVLQPQEPTRLPGMGRSSCRPSINAISSGFLFFVHLGQYPQGEDKIYGITTRAESILPF